MRTAVAKQKRPHLYRKAESESARPTRAPIPDRSSSISHLQRTAGNRAVNQLLRSGLPTIVESVLAGSGRPLDPETRAEMESRIGADFGDVRVHADNGAAVAAASIGAMAYSVGRDVVFDSQAYQPDTPAGRALIAHELAHVAQDATGRGNGESSMLETEADRAAGYAPIPGQPQQQVRVGGQALHRKPRPGPDPDIEFMLILALDPLPSSEARKAFDAYRKMTTVQRKKALESHFKGKTLKKLLHALPKADAINTYPDEIREMLRFVEEASTREATGKTDAKMAEAQAGFIKAKAASPPGWGGATTTRWGGLLPLARKAWTTRGNKAIDDMVKHASTHAPELKLTKSSFELEFDAVDRTSLGALATVGSKRGKTVRVGFEFVVTIEINPAYALSTVVHELHGHPIYDEKAGAPNYAGKLYKDAAAKVPRGAKIDRSGDESFNYWPSEIYSLLKEIPYWTAVTPVDKKKSLNPPGSTTSADKLNYDPRGMVEHWLNEIKKYWEPSLVNGIVRGFYKRIVYDTTMARVSVTEFKKIVEKVFPKTDAAIILK